MVKCIKLYEMETMVPVARRQSSKIEKYNSMLVVVVTLMVVANQLLLVMTSYVPYGRYSGSGIRRSDPSEEDDMDQTASSPYQQGNNNGGASDGYEENEPDGPYGETPREEEGQADMEKFFDDHLGASERDGMDKENLPSNLKPQIFIGDELPAVIDPTSPIDKTEAGYDHAVGASEINRNYLSNRQDDLSDLDKRLEESNIKAQDNHENFHDKMGADFEGNRDQPLREDQSGVQDELGGSSSSPAKAASGLDADGSEIVAIEDEDMDKIYVTNMTNQPFKIDALGGYDPEEDFQAASRDIEEPGNFSLPRAKRRSSRDRHRSLANRSGRGEREEASGARDITFNDPEADTLFNDASETDEVTFGYDDPYKVDLEAEIQGQSSTRPPVKLRNEPLDELDFDGPETRPQRKSYIDDDSESNWVNDGVDDMEVPSQAYQDSVLDKAAKQQAIAERNAAADHGQLVDNPEDSDNQQMPNADYMKDDLKELDGKKAR